VSHFARNGRLLAQLLPQFFPFLGCELAPVLACRCRRALGLQNVAQFGPALLTLGGAVRHGLELCTRLRQGMAREAKNGQ
jgi:hypothetical protein